MIKKLITKVKLLIPKITKLIKFNSKTHLIVILVFFAFILQFYCNFDSIQIQKFYEITTIYKTVDLRFDDFNYPDLLIVGDLKIFSSIFEVKTSLCLISNFFFFY